MHCQILYTLILWVWGVNSKDNNNLPWFLWPNMTEPVVVLTPEIYYPQGQQPTLLARLPRRRIPVQQPHASDILTRPPEPTTNVSNSAATQLSYYVCCVCIPQYSCVNGVAVMQSFDPQYFDINYATCPYESDVCCPLPDTPDECGPQLPPDITDSPISNFIKRSVDNPAAITGECECLHYELCPVDLVIRSSSHDSSSQSLSIKCENEFEVCCSLSDLPNNSPFAVDVLQSETCQCMEESTCLVMMHLLGIPSEDYVSNIHRDQCLNATQVCCSFPAMPGNSTQDHLLYFQTPAVTYKDGGKCYGYFHSDKLQVSIK